MTIEYLKGNYRKLGSKDCDLAACCSTCMYRYSATRAAGYKWEDELDSYCVYRKKAEAK